MAAGRFVHEGLHGRVQLDAALAQIGVLVQHQYLRPGPPITQRGGGIAERCAPVVEAQRRVARLPACDGGREPV